MLKIKVETIPHADQRYDTVGDYEMGEKQGEITIKVSDFGNSDTEFLIGIHELVESYLCKKHGVTDEMIDEFDISYRKKYGVNAPEPGFDSDAPYYKEHLVADKIERIMAGALDIDWDEYEKTQANMYIEGR